MFYTNVIRNKNKLYHIGYENGERFIRDEVFDSFISLETRKYTGLKTFQNVDAERKYFDTFADRKREIELKSDLFKIYDNIDIPYQFIVGKYDKDISYDVSKIHILAYDIECIDINDEYSGFPNPDEAPLPITAITIKDLNTKNIYVLSMATFYQEQMKIEVEGKIFYKVFASEQELLKKFCLLIMRLQPDILTGWNIQSFDNPYTVNRIGQILGNDYLRMLSPLGMIPTVRSREKFDKGRKRKVYHTNFYGISTLDMLDLYKKYNVPANGEKESYSLNHIATCELGETKVAYEEFDNLKQLYFGNPQLFVEYNIMDVELIDQINRKFKYIELQIFLAYYSRCLFEDVFSPVKVWDCAIFNYCYQNNIVIPPAIDGENEAESYAGAYVKDPILGLHKWVVSYDVNSLYPSVIVFNNLCASTIVDEFIKVKQSGIDDKFLNREFDFSNEKYIVSGAGYKFMKDKKGIIPILIEKLYSERVVFKTEMLQLIKDDGDKNRIAMLSTKEQAVKILMNSLYGGLANIYSRYYDIRLASSITLTSQFVIRWLEKYTNEFFDNMNNENSLIYLDTDSNYFTLDKIVPKNLSTIEKVDWIDNFCETKLSPLIDEALNDLVRYLNSETYSLKMKRELICESAVWKKKKMYAMMVWDKEGKRYKEPQLKVKGIEIVRSSTPTKIRGFLSDCVKLMLTTPEQVMDYIDDVRVKFHNMPVEDISFPRSANNLWKWTDPDIIFKKGTPVAVKGVLMYNEYLNRFPGRWIDYTPIQEGDKVKFVYLKESNPILNTTVVSFVRKFPPIDKKYVDMKKMLDKSYLNVIYGLADAFGIKIDYSESLDDMF